MPSDFEKVVEMLWISFYYLSTLKLCQKKKGLKFASFTLASKIEHINHVMYITV